MNGLKYSHEIPVTSIIPSFEAIYKGHPRVPLFGTWPPLDTFTSMYGDRPVGCARYVPRLGHMTTLHKTVREG